MNFNKTDLSLFTLSILVALAAFALFLYVTVNGIGISPDSTTYIATANGLLDGDGFFVDGRPRTYFPPIYPILLALSGSLTANVTDAARWLHAIIYGINAVLFGLLIYIHTQHNRLAMITGSLVFLSSKTILESHTYAWSESPFIWFTLLSLLLLSFYLAADRWIYLFVAAISLGLAIATRYIGISLLPPVLISMVIFVKKPFQRKLRDILTILLAGVPIGVWVVRNLITAQAATNRSFVYHPISSEKIRSGINAFSNQYLGGISAAGIMVLAAVVTLLLCGLLYIGVVLFKKRSLLSPSQNLNLIFITIGLSFFVSYFAVLLFSITFFDASTPIDGRLLLPVFVLGILTLFPLISLYSSVYRHKRAWRLLIAGAFGWFLASTPIMMRAAMNSHANGIGYNSVAWNQSPTLAKLSSLHPEVEIYSNGSDIIRYKLGINARSLPAYFSSSSLVVNETFDAEFSAMCGTLAGGEAILVYLNGITWRDYYPSKQAILAKCELPILYDTSDGTIYGLQVN